MQYRPGLMALALLAAFPQSTAEAATRVSLAIAKSSHPESARDYNTVHPGLGVTGRLTGEWLRWRAGVVRHSHSRWGPVTGLAATWGVAENWRMGLSAGVVGNYPRGHWVRRGVVPIVQWMDEDRDHVWEFVLARNERVTFVGVGLQIPTLGPRSETDCILMEITGALVAWEHHRPDRLPNPERSTVEGSKFEAMQAQRRAIKAAARRRRYPRVRNKSSLSIGCTRIGYISR